MRCCAWLMGLVCLLPFGVLADQRAPGWFDASWHYRIAIDLPAAVQPGSTVVLDADFIAALGQLGVAGSFDANSARVVRADGTSLVATQEFNDNIVAGATDATGDGDGEIRFLSQDAGPATYWLYFDITQNGLKAALPAATSINGNFEHSVGATPTNWLTSAVFAGGAQNNEVHRQPPEAATISIPAGCSNNAANNLDNSAFTGDAFHLLGYRDNCEDGGGNVELIRIERQIRVPAVNAGNLTYQFRMRASDSLQAAGNQYDWMRLEVNGAVVNHTTLAIPNPGNILRIRNLGVGRRNGFSAQVIDAGWQPVTLNLAAFAGQTITVRMSMRFFTDNVYRTWIRLDDVEWSRQNATLDLNQVQAFGVDIQGGAASVGVGQTLTISAIVDANPTRSITASVFNPADVAVASGIPLFDDATHGDLTAGDGIYVNDGSDALNPTYTMLPTDAASNDWEAFVYAADLSTSTVGAALGLVHISGQPNTPEGQANFWNIDEQLFSLTKLDLVFVKSMFTVSDPVNNQVSPYNIPGAVVEYRVNVSNQGAGTSDNDSIFVTDPIPANTALVVSDIGAAGSGPVSLVDGSPSSNLTYSFTALNSATDDVSFSSNGGADLFTYVPAPDGNGTDPNVTHIRINPKGILAGNSGSGAPSFQLRFRVRID